MNSEETNTQRALFEIDLKEIELVFAQGHVRMTIVSTLTNISVTLAGVVATGIATVVAGSKELPLLYYLVIPLPFFLFAFLVLREDLLMVHHDFYLYRLRKRLLKEIGCSTSHPSLRFLSDIKAAKLGPVRSVATVLSALRYGPPVLVLVPCVVWFSAHAKWSLTPESFLYGFLLLANGCLMLALLLGIARLGALHEQNEILVPPALKDVG